MIEGYLFDLKGKKRWKALGERILFIFTDYRIYLIIIMFIMFLFQLNLISQQQEILRSLK